MPHLRLGLLVLLLAGCFMPFVSFTPLELLLGAIAGLGAIGIADLLGAVKPADTPEGIVFNPREWPKYFAVLIIELTGYLLYFKLNHAELGTPVYFANIAFIFIVVVVPALILLILLFRNRNDRITLSSTELKWQDNEAAGTITVAEISSVTPVQALKFLIIPNHYLRVELQNNEHAIIPVHQMNFTWRDTQITARKIQSAISK